MPEDKVESSVESLRTEKKDDHPTGTEGIVQALRAIVASILESQTSILNLEARQALQAELDWLDKEMEKHKPKETKKPDDVGSRRTN